MKAGVVPSRDCEGRSPLCLSPSLQQLLEVFGVPWLTNASLQSLPPSSH